MVNKKTNNPAKTFQDLIVWQKSHQFVLSIYKITKQFPSDERFGLISQIRRAAVSIPANIVEGFTKRTNADKVRYYNIAKGSIEEIRYYLILSRDLGYSDNSKLLILLEEISKMLNSFIKKILNTGY